MPAAPSSEKLTVIRWGLQALGLIMWRLKRVALRLQGKKTMNLPLHFRQRAPGQPCVVFLCVFSGLYWMSQQVDQWVHCPCARAEAKQVWAWWALGWQTSGKPGGSMWCGQQMAVCPPVTVQCNPGWCDASLYCDTGLLTPWPFILSASVSLLCPPSCVCSLWGGKGAPSPLLWFVDKRDTTKWLTRDYRLSPYLIPTSLARFLCIKCNKNTNNFPK